VVSITVERSKNLMVTIHSVDNKEARKGVFFQETNLDSEWQTRA
jgi:hypothetical protein